MNTNVFAVHYVIQIAHAPFSKLTIVNPHSLFILSEDLKLTKIPIVRISLLLMSLLQHYLRHASANVSGGFLDEESVFYSLVIVEPM